MEKQNINFPSQGQYIFSNAPLADLNFAVSASIEQKFELIEALSGWETQNHYYISVFDNQGNISLKQKNYLHAVIECVVQVTVALFKSFLRKFHTLHKEKNKKKISLYFLVLLNALAVVVIVLN